MFLLSDPQTPEWGLKSAIKGYVLLIRLYKICLKAPIRGFGGHIQNILFNIIYHLDIMILIEILGIVDSYYSMGNLIVTCIPLPSFDSILIVPFKTCTR